MNDVQTTRTEEILAKYRRVIRSYKKLHHIIVSGILPKINALAGFHRNASSINTRLKYLCEEEYVS